MSTKVRPFQHKDSEGIVIDHDEYPSVYVIARGDVEMSGREVRTEDREGFVAWLRQVADEIEAAS